MLRTSKSSHRRNAAASLAPTLESLEGRRLLSDGPVIHSIVADNRGEATLQVQDYSNVQIAYSGNNAANVFVAGPSGNPSNSDHIHVPATVSYNVANGQITINANLPAATPYEVVVKSKDIVDSNTGLQLDGEFNGDTVPTGDGNPGGNLVFATGGYNDNHKIAIFNSVQGQFEVALIKKSQDPTTIANFQKYANKGLWDGIVVNRSLLQGDPAASIGILQAGTYNLINNDTAFGQVSNLGYFNQAQDNSNTAFTISMATNKFGAANTFFFNTADNSQTLDGLGFSSFGTVTTSLGDLIISTINLANTTDLSTLVGPPIGNNQPNNLEFENFPYVSTFHKGKKYVYNHLSGQALVFTRVSMAMKVGAAETTSPDLPALSGRIADGSLPVPTPVSDNLMSAPGDSIFSGTDPSAAGPATLIESNSSDILTST